MATYIQTKFIAVTLAQTNGDVNESADWLTPIYATVDRREIGRWTPGDSDRHSVTQELHEQNGDGDHRRAEWGGRRGGNAISGNPIQDFLL